MRTLEHVPVAIRSARAMWFIAIGAGVFETLLVIASGRADGQIGGVALRVVVFVAAFIVVMRMSAGARWARWTLLVGLGVLGTLSLTVDPVLWLADGNSLTQAITRSGTVDLIFGASRVIHVAAVLSACVLMFRPSANAYFRAPDRPAAIAVG